MITMTEMTMMMRECPISVLVICWLQQSETLTSTVQSHLCLYLNNCLINTNTNTIINTNTNQRHSLRQTSPSYKFSCLNIIYLKSYKTIVLIHQFKNVYIDISIDLFRFIASNLRSFPRFLFATLQVWFPLYMYIVRLFSKHCKITSAMAINQTYVMLMFKFYILYFPLCIYTYIYVDVSAIIYNF